jgi:glutamate racemase
LIQESAVWGRRPEAARIVKKSLRPIKDYQVETLILACSHSPISKRLFQKKTGAQVRLVTGRSAQVQALVKCPARRPDLDRRLSKKGRRRFEVSDPAGLPPRLGARLFGRRVTLTQAPAGPWE